MGCNCVEDLLKEFLSVCEITIALDGDYGLECLECLACSVSDLDSAPSSGRPTT